MAIKTKPSTAIRGGSQEGSTSLEFAFSLMPVVFALMFFMGMGYTIGSKQHSVMAARYTTTAYVASRNGSTYTKPSDHDVADAAFNGVEQWQTAEQRAIVLELARQLDLHDAEHVGAWGKPDLAGCVWC